MDKKVAKECADRLKQMRQDILSSITELNNTALELEGDTDTDDMDKSANLSEMDRIKNLRISHSARIRSIDAAERRITTGNFGICALCEEDIPKKRLLANPLAIRCIGCQEEQELLEKESKMRTRGQAPESFTDDLGDED